MSIPCAGNSRGVLVRDGRAVGPNQGEVLAVVVELEVRVQRRGRNDAVLLRREDHEIAVRRERVVWKPPLRQRVVVIGQIPAVEVDRGDRRVVDLDPIGVIPVVVGQAGLVDRQELGDQKRPGGQQHPRLQRLVEQPPRRAPPRGAVAGVSRRCRLPDRMPSEQDATLTVHLIPPILGQATESRRGNPPSRDVVSYHVHDHRPAAARQAFCKR